MLADLYTQGTIQRIDGPLLFLRRNLDVGLNDAVEVVGEDGHGRLGRVATLDEETIVVEVLESTAGLSLDGPKIRFFGEPLLSSVGAGLLGRVFDGVGRPLDGGPPVPGSRRWRIDGVPLNPVARAKPADFIETGISAIDLMNSLVRGQKLPIFSGGGLPHDRLAVEIAQHARAPGEEAGRFAIVFAGIGISYDTAEYFRRAMEESGALTHTVLFLNLASDPSTQRLLTPRFALTAAEYLAFQEGRHVLVIMTDMTNYCEALREVAASHGVIPGRKGYPAYLYSDLATLYERAGQLKRGSIFGGSASWVRIPPPRPMISPREARGEHGIAAMVSTPRPGARAPSALDSVEQCRRRGLEEDVRRIRLRGCLLAMMGSARRRRASIGSPRPGRSGGSGEVGIVSERGGRARAPPPRPRASRRRPARE